MNALRIKITRKSLLLLSAKKTQRVFIRFIGQRFVTIEDQDVVTSVWVLTMSLIAQQKEICGDVDLGWSIVDECGVKYTTKKIKTGELPGKRGWRVNCCISSTNQKCMKTLGIALLVLGLVMTVFTGFNVVTKKKVVDLGPVEINKEERTPVYWSPITGGILLVAGVIILVAGKRKI